MLIPGLGIKVGGSARWFQLGPLPAVHPAEFAKLALVIYLAHGIGGVRDLPVPTWLFFWGAAIALVIGAVMVAIRRMRR